jgi:hypothetical protein
MRRLKNTNAMLSELYLGANAIQGPFQRFFIYNLKFTFAILGAAYYTTNVA